MKIKLDPYELRDLLLETCNELRDIADGLDHEATKLEVAEENKKASNVIYLFEGEKT